MTTLATTVYPNVPAWAKESLPEWLTPYLGRRGATPAWSAIDAPMGRKVAGIDFWQANHFINHRPETAQYLYSVYTPTTLHYKPGTFPLIESKVAHLRGKPPTIALAVEVLTTILPAIVKHPTVPPCGPHVLPNRALDDDALVASGVAWCNEQSRVFVRLCQCLGIPARMIFLFFGDGKTGHVSSEFYAENRWVHADPSWFCVFPGPNGIPMSAAECHTPQGKPLVAAVLAKRLKALDAMTDMELGVDVQPNARKSLVEWQGNLSNLLESFGVLNHPLPT
jgi:hypothetical protein